MKVEHKDSNSWELLVTETSDKFPSETVPDQTYSVAELLERHRQGILTDTEIRRDTEYVDQDDLDFDTQDFEKFRDSDLVDQDEYMQMVKDDLQKAEDKRKADIAAAKAKEDAEYEEFKKQKASQPFLNKEKGSEPPERGSSATERSGESETRKG